MLDVRGLTGGWGITNVIQQLDLAIQPGEVVSIIGRNGVGKTTLLELIVGRATYCGGSVQVNGSALQNLPVYRRAELGIGYVPQQREVFPSLSVAEHLWIARRPGKWTAEAIYDLFPSLAQRQASLGRELSGGEQQMLAIARALIGNPKLLLMDEPSEGLAPVVVEHLVHSIKGFTGQGGITVLLVEQRIDVAIELSKRCFIMDRGRIVRDIATADIAHQPEQLSYLIGLTGEPVKS